MNRLLYKKIVDKYKPKENKFKNGLISFVCGGVIGLASQLLSALLVNVFNIPLMKSYSITTLVIIFITSLCTGFGFFDNLVEKFKCGLIIPTTGFSHSVSSSCLEFKNDGMITGIGSNCFKLAGSVIVYAILFSFCLVFIKVVFNYV